MDDDDSEDVVLMDSPLYCHLKEMGFQDFETAQRCESISTPESLQPIEIPEKSKLHHTFYLKGVLKNLHEQVMNVLSALNAVLATEVKEIIAASHLLQESDQALLEDILNDSSLHHSTSEKHSCFSIQNMHWTRPLGITTTILALSYMITLVTYLETSVWNGIILTVLSLYIIVIVFLWTFYYLWANKSAHLRRKTTELLCRACTLQELFKTGIRMIQEAELIARGFTLISVQATAHRLESSISLPVRAPEKQCPELREAIFRFARKCFFCYREATNQLLKLFPLHKDVDMSSHYLACIKLEDLGPLFMDVEPETNPKSLEELTDFYSVSSLKSVFQLMELQQSELFRRFGLSFLYGISSNTDEIAIRNVCQVHSKLEDIITYLIGPVSDAIGGLQKLQLYYKHLGNSNPCLETSYGARSSSKYQNTPFKTAVHSLLLHLQASIIRVQDLESEIETFPENRELCQELSLSYEKRLLEIKSELDASTVCLEESFSRLSPLSFKTQTDISKEIKVIKMISPESPKSPIPLFEMGDPVIEDQVFEAFTTYLEDELKNDMGSEFWFSDEKLLRKKAKESSANLLKELKSVLVQKAEEHQKREEVAKSKQSSDECELSMVDSTESNLEPNTSKSCDFMDMSETTLVGKICESIDSGKVIGKSDSDSTGSIEIINSDSPPEEKLLDFIADEHDSASTGSIEACADSPVVELTSDLTSILGDSRFNFTAALAAQVAQRSQFFGLKQQTFTAEPEETFGDSDEESDN